MLACFFAPNINQVIRASVFVAKTNKKRRLSRHRKVNKNNVLIDSTCTQAILYIAA